MYLPGVSGTGSDRAPSGTTMSLPSGSMAYPSVISMQSPEAVCYDLRLQPP